MAIIGPVVAVLLGLTAGVFGGDWLSGRIIWHQSTETHIKVLTFVSIGAVLIWCIIVALVTT